MRFAGKLEVCLKKRLSKLLVTVARDDVDDLTDRTDTRVLSGLKGGKVGLAGATNSSSSGCVCWVEFKDLIDGDLSK